MKRGPKPEPNDPITPLPGIPDPPKWLDKVAKDHWKEVTNLLKDANILSKLDRDALTNYCQLWSTWREALTELAKPVEDGGGVVITAPNKYRQKNPWYEVARDAQKDISKYQGDFGLSPKARAKLTMPEDQTVDRKWEDLL